MDITLVIGNGFDKALGLKTGYYDFYDWLNNQQLDDNYIRIMKERIQRDKNKNRIKDIWSDFEKGIGQFVTRIIKDDLPDDFSPWKSGTDNFLVKYLSSLDTSAKVRAILQSNKNMQRCHDYIQGFILSMKLLKSELFSDIDETVQGHMISLNYTDSLDQIASNMQIMNNSMLQIDSGVLHPHGQLSTGVILGVNDVSQINNVNIQQDVSYSSMMVKSAQIKALYQDVKDEAINYIKKSTIICLYGVSLGETDKDWWQLLGDWLQNDKKHLLIVFWYVPKGKETKKDLSFIQKTFVNRPDFQEEDRIEIYKRLIVFSHNREFLFSQQARRVFSLGNGIDLPMILVEAGSFTMSKKDGENEASEREHNAELTRDFYIGETQVTQEQYIAIAGNNPSKFNSGKNLPVEQVTWYEAMDFCAKLNEKKLAPTGYHFSLPTETQWEYAARGGKESKGYKFSGSNNIDEVAWYNENSVGKTHEVKTKKPNELGIYDMSGNVWEWCLDDYIDDSSKMKPEFIRENDKSTKQRVDRGGAWDYKARVALRSKHEPTGRRLSIGFRVALVPDQY